MRKSTSLKDFEELTEQIKYMEAKISFLKEKFPDNQTKINRNGIPFAGRHSSEQVNINYTNIDFIRRYGSLIVMPYSLVEFTYKDKTEQIKIHSNPATSRLAYITSKYITENVITNGVVVGKVKNPIRQINFSKVVVNFKNNNFNDSMINECRLKILELIQRHPNYKLNTKHLDDRLKKLLAFT
jgi:hypothetical protein